MRSLSSPDSLMIGTPTVFGAEGWAFELLQPVSTEYGIPDLGIQRPLMRLPIRAIRDTNYYLLTMMLPMSLIMFMSWMAFWLPPSIVPARMAISTASIFSFIAFRLQHPAAIAARVLPDQSRRVRAGLDADDFRRAGPAP